MGISLPFSFSVFVFFSVVPRSASSYSFSLFFLCLFRFTAVIFYCLFSVATQAHTHTLKYEDANADADAGSAVVASRRERATAQRAPQWRQTRFLLLPSSAFSLACALSTLTLARRALPQTPHTHSRTHSRKTNVAAAVAVVSVSFTLLTLHVQIQIHSVNAIPRGRNVKRRFLPGVFLAPVQSRAEQLLKRLPPPPVSGRPSPPRVHCVCASQRYNKLQDTRVSAR